MNSIHSRPTAARLGKAIAFAALSSLAILNCLGGNLRPLNYDTPSYIEMELPEIRASEGANRITINLFRTGEFRVTTKVNYSTVARTASEGSDYKPAGGTVIFKPGEGFKVITLELIADNEIEEDESFDLVLSGGNENTIIPQERTAIVIQNATPVSETPSLNIAMSEKEIRLSWEGHTEAILERTINATGGDWQPVRCIVKKDGDRCEVAESAGGQLFFYRLRIP